MTEAFLMLAHQACTDVNKRQPGFYQRSRLANVRPAASPRLTPVPAPTPRSRHVGKSAISASSKLPKPPSAADNLHSAPMLIEQYVDRVDEPEQQENKPQTQKTVVQQPVDPAPIASAALAPQEDQSLSDQTRSQLGIADQPELLFKSQPSAHCLAEGSQQFPGGVNRTLCSQLASHLAQCLVPSEFQQRIHHQQHRLVAPVPRFQFDTPSPDDQVLHAVANRPKLQLHSAKNSAATVH